MRGASRSSCGGRPVAARKGEGGSPQLQSHCAFFLDDPLTGGASTCIATPSACASVTTDASDYDAMGHYRLTTTSETLLSSVASKRLERTEWNQFQPGPPANNQRWILDTYTFQQQQEGSAVERQEADFEPGTGFLHCTRRLKSGTGRGSH